MVVNALNSGASCFMADFEDSTTPTWANLLLGQQNLADAIRRLIDFEDPQSGKSYRLAERTAVLLVRPRGWHLSEKHVIVDGEPMSARCSTSGSTSSTTARSSWSAAAAPISICRRWRAIRRPGSGTTCSCTRRSARHPGRLDQGHGADRDHPRHLRARRDPLRAARSHGGPELRPLGLYLQLHQEAAELPEPPAARPGAGDDDRTLHARLQPTRDPDLPSPRCPCDGRHGSPDPDQGGQGPERGGAGQGPRRQGARGQRRA